MIIIRINPHHHFHHLIFHFHSRYETESSVEIYKIDTVPVEKKKKKKKGLHLLRLQVLPDKGTFQVDVNKWHSTAMIRGGKGGAHLLRMQFIMLTTILGRTK